MVDLMQRQEVLAVAAAEIEAIITEQQHNHLKVAIVEHTDLEIVAVVVLAVDVNLEVAVVVPAV